MLRTVGGAVVRVTSYPGIMRRGATWHPQHEDAVLAALPRAAQPVGPRAAVKRRRAGVVVVLHTTAPPPRGGYLE